jgi:hypothetical protein
MKEINLLYYILFYLPHNKGVENILQLKMLTAVTINWKLPWWVWHTFQAILLSCQRQNVDSCHNKLESCPGGSGTLSRQFSSAVRDKMLTAVTINWKATLVGLAHFPANSTQLPETKLGFSSMNILYNIHIHNKPIMRQITSSSTPVIFFFFFLALCRDI